MVYIRAGTFEHNWQDAKRYFLRNNIMIISFREIGINLGDYQGLTFEKIHPLIINQCADYILDFEGDYDYEIFTHYNWEIDYVRQQINIPHNALLN
jgi:hypothetical protein